MQSHPLEQPTIETPRLVLESITKAHAQELCDFFADPLLHEFVPFEPPTFAQQLERCEKWEKRQSPIGDEIWLNWAARDKETGRVIGHFQSGVKEDQSASIGYVVARTHQGKGLASEAMLAIFDILRSQFKVRIVKAWSDSRNKPSHRLAERLGMVHVETLIDADFFKGEKSDEFVFAKDLTQ